MTFKWPLFIFLALAFNAYAEILAEGSFAPKTAEDDKQKLESYQQRCELIANLSVKNSFKLDCFSNYHHYYPSSGFRRENIRSGVKIAGYNLLHPGTSKALFKDYSLVAKIANKFDVVSGLEILTTVGHDESNNKSVLKLYQKTTDAKMASALYRVPGYFRLLTELKKLDPTWGLILSPRGDSALEGSVEEMVGYYYRGSIVKPVINPHCQDYKGANSGTPVACLINLRQEFMGKNLVQHFSRRPFMASFESGKFKFSLVSSHVVYTYSGDEAAQKNLLVDTFGTDSLDNLGPGITLGNFARFAEVKNTLDFMNRYIEKYKDPNIMFVADTNLTPNIPFWSEVLKSLPGSSVLINEPTTISPIRYSSEGKETFGVANSYDHFILNPKTFSNCNAGEVYNYYRSDISADIEKAYGIFLGTKHKSFDLYADDEAIPLDQDEELPLPEDMGPLKLDYVLSREGQRKMDKFAHAYTDYLNSLFTVKDGKVVQDDFQIKERIDALRKRVFLKQLTNTFYYKHYQELLSDHFPISITCTN